MEPITTAIVAALIAGAAAGTTEVGKSALVDAYKGFKGILTKKFGKKENLTKAVTDLEQNPKSQGRQLTLQEEVQTALADQDHDVLQAAKLLAIAVQRYAEQVNIGADLEDVKGAIIRIDSAIDHGIGVKMKKTEAEGEINIKARVGQIDPNA